MSKVGMFALFMLIPGCGASVMVDNGEVPDAAADAPVEASAPPQCLCPNAPGYAACVKPMECCPVVGQCENPASFNCTGSTKSCPP